MKMKDYEARALLQRLVDAMTNPTPGAAQVLTPDALAAAQDFLATTAAPPPWTVAEWVDHKPEDAALLATALKEALASIETVSSYGYLPAGSDDELEEAAGKIRAVLAMTNGAE